MWRLLFSLLVLVGLPSQAWALTFDEHTSRLPVGSELQVLEDPSGEATLVEVRGPLRERFRSVTKDVFNAGYSRSAYWLQLDLDYRPREGNRPRTWLLELAYPPMDRVDLYLPGADGRYQLAERTGDTLPFSNRAYQQASFVFELDLQPGTPQRVYLRLQSEGSIQAPLTIWSPKAFLEAQPAHLYMLGMIYGVLLVMLLYNLLLYVSLRLKAYFYYIGYIASFGLYQVSVNGAGQQYLWPDSPGWANTATPFLIGSAILFGCQFARHFLETAHIGRNWDRLLVGLGLLGAVAMGVALVSSYGVALRLSTGLALVFTLVMATVGWVAWVRGMRTARFFIIAWSAFLVGGFINTLMVLGYLPHTFFSMYASQIGSALEVGLLSLALADRIRHMQDERARLLERSREELATLNTELAQANRLKDEFLGTLSHELRTPMNGVLGGLELLRPEADERERQEFFSLTEGAARDMLRLIDNLLALTELQAGRMALRPAAFSLRRLLDQLRHGYAPLAEAKGLRFEVELEANVPDGLVSDADRLAQALGQVLDNAVRFTEQGFVRLRVSRCDATGHRLGLRFEVIDSGIGFDPDAVALYDPLRQIDGSMTRQHGGLGIGLALARGLGELLGGRLSHASTPGQGSCFRLELTFELSEPVRLPVGSAERASCG